MDDRNFVVISTQRSGSAWLLSMLNSVEGVDGQGELFLPRERTDALRWDSGFAYPRYYHEYPGKHRLLRFRSVFRYLDQFYGRPGVHGFKLMYSQMRKCPATVAYLRMRRVRAIHLVRRNHLDVIVSNRLRDETGEAHLLIGQAASRPLRVRVETNGLLKKLAWLEQKQSAGHRLLRWLGLAPLEVTYESLVADPNRFFEICDFLSINAAHQPPQSQVARIRTKNLAETVINFDEVERVVANSPFAYCLADPKSPGSERKSEDIASVAEPPRRH